MDKNIFSETQSLVSGELFWFVLEFPGLTPININYVIIKDKGRKRTRRPSAFEKWYGYGAS